MGKQWLNPIKLKQGPAIVAVVTDQNSKQQLRKAITAGVTIFEVRVDLFRDRSVANVVTIVKRIESMGAAVLLTVRSSKEGSPRRIGSGQRLAIFQAAIPFVSAVDIELSSKNIISEVIALAGKHKKKIMVSYHNFQKTPTTAFLRKIVKEGRKLHADFIKIATMARNPQDIKWLAELLLSSNANDIIVIAMGKQGGISRAFFPALGSPFMYAGLSSSVAPGQISLRQLCKLREMFYAKRAKP